MSVGCAQLSDRRPVGRPMPFYRTCPLIALRFWSTPEKKWEISRTSLHDVRLLWNGARSGYRTATRVRRCARPAGRSLPSRD